MRLRGILAWHIREGLFGDVGLDDLSVLALGAFEGNVRAGAKVDRALFVDERAYDGQREALRAIWSGQAGGWPAYFG
jgi:hypothetical protein